jgi:GT2 family glycosyltransferase/glycosyltransferase involved in cell wall biosynthesis
MAKKVIGAKSPPKVLLVAHKLSAAAQAGTEKYCLSLGKALTDRGAQVTLLAPQGPLVQNPEEEISWRWDDLAGLPFLYFNRINPDVQASLSHPGFEAAFRALLSKYSFDFVHFHHTYLSSISLLGVALAAEIPTILTLHDAWHLCPRLHLMNETGLCSGPESPEKCATCLESRLSSPTAEARRQLARLFARRQRYVKKTLPFCRLLAPSRFLRNLHYEYGVARGEILHLPLGLDEMIPLVPETPAPPGKFVFLGNLIPVKRVDVAVQAFAGLAGQASLEIWGQLPANDEQKFQADIAPYPHISYCGSYHRGDLPRLLAGAAATVITSDFENYPLVVRESLMLKTPVIASEVGGIPEIIQEGKNGFLFPAGDAVALRRLVRRLLRHPELLERARTGMGPVKTMREEAGELLDLYQSLTTKLRPAIPFRAAGLEPIRAASPEGPKPGGTPPAITAEDKPGCSIIIPVFNNLELTRNCLASIYQHTEPGSLEIIVVDNGSTDGTGPFLREQGDRGRVSPIFNAANLGFARASNQGARAAAGEFLVFLNNDTLVTPGWLAELTNSAAQEDRIAAVGAKLLFPDDSVQHAGVAVNSDVKVFHIYKHFHRDHPAVNKFREFQALTAACLLVRREAFFEAGLFDEGFVNGFEDVDLCFKLRNLGWKIFYNYRSVVYHLESKTPGRHAREQENAARLAARWHDRIRPDEELHYAADGIIVHTIRLATGDQATLMYDPHENPFWRQAVTLRQAGALEEACEQYLHALKFNPFDSRLWLIGAELAELLERLGKPQEAELHRRCLAKLLPAGLQVPEANLRAAAG